MQITNKLYNDRTIKSPKWFTTDWNPHKCLHDIIFIRKLKTIIKIKENETTKSTNSRLYAVQNINKNEWHRLT